MNPITHLLVTTRDVWMDGRSLTVGLHVRARASLQYATKPADPNPVLIRTELQSTPLLQFLIRQLSIS